jgi:hypothetical protein
MRLISITLCWPRPKARGRFEAIPIEKVGDGFKLRWRDYATLPPAIRPRLELALIYPDAA